MRNTFPLLIKVAKKLFKIQSKPDFRIIGTLNEFYDLIISNQFSVQGINVPGWLTVCEKRALYGLARWLPGPFLEIGPWVGLSTAIICKGIEDSPDKKTFITAEVNPGIDNFRPYNGGIGFFIPSRAEFPKGMTTLEVFEKDIKPVLQAEGGVLGELKRNLMKYNQIKRVEIFDGHFKDVKKLNYRLVFIDAMHDEGEIMENARLLMPFLSKDCVLACHDILDSNEKFLLSMIDFKEYVKFDTLFVGIVK